MRYGLKRNICYGSPPAEWAAASPGPLEQRYVAGCFRGGRPGPFDRSCCCPGDLAVWHGLVAMMVGNGMMVRRTMRGQTSDGLRGLERSLACLWDFANDANEENSYSHSSNSCASNFNVRAFSLTVRRTSSGNPSLSWLRSPPR